MCLTCCIGQCKAAVNLVMYFSLPTHQGKIRPLTGLGHGQELLAPVVLDGNRLSAAQAHLSAGEHQIQVTSNCESILNIKR